MTTMETVRMLEEKKKKKVYRRVYKKKSPDFSRNGEVFDYYYIKYNNNILILNYNGWTGWYLVNIDKETKEKYICFSENNSIIGQKRIYLDFSSVNKKV